MNYNSAAAVRFLNTAKSQILVRVQFDNMSDAIDFVADPNDTELHGREIFARAMAGEFGEILPPDGYEIDSQGNIIPSTETLSNQLSIAKQAALATFEAKADAYQTKFLGANSPQREARFAKNLAAAKRVVADNGTPEDLQSMALQAQAKAAETGETPKTALEFAAWIAAWEGKTTLIAGAIEAFLVQSRSGLNALTELAQIEPYLSQIAAQAEAKFAELAG